jgi:hypothetical protein
MYICIYIYIYLHVNWPLFLSDFKEMFSGHIFEKYYNKNYHEKSYHWEPSFWRDNVFGFDGYMEM